MVQDPNKVKLADVSPETKEILKIFLSEQKLHKRTLNEEPLKTLEDAVLFAVQEAGKVPKLEDEIKQLRHDKCEEYIKVLRETRIIEEDIED